jgi:hypothetical protein
MIYKSRKVHLQTIKILQVEQAKIWDATLEERTLHMEWVKWDYCRGFSIFILNNSNCKGVGERKRNNDKIKNQEIWHKSVSNCNGDCWEC